MDNRFNQYKASLRNFLRKRGAQINVRNKTISIDRDQLNWKEETKLKELLKYGYIIINNEENPPPSHTFKGEDTFIAFADEIISMYE